MLNVFIKMVYVLARKHCKHAISTNYLIQEEPHNNNVTGIICDLVVCTVYQCPPVFSPVSTSVHQRPPASTSVHQRPPASTSVHQRPPASTSVHQRPPGSTRVHQGPAASTNVHQRLPESTSVHQLPPASTIVEELDSRGSGSSAIDQLSLVTSGVAWYLQITVLSNLLD